MLVLLGIYEGAIDVNPDEVKDYKWISIPELMKDMEKKPYLYTEWFKILMKNLKDTDLFHMKNA